MPLLAMPWHHLSLLPHLGAGINGADGPDVSWITSMMTHPVRSMGMCDAWRWQTQQPQQHAAGCTSILPAQPAVWWCLQERLLGHAFVNMVANIGGFVSSSSSCFLAQGKGLLDSHTPPHVTSPP